jgi:hypothetical protein
MIPGRFAAAEGRGAPLAEGLGADSNLLYFLGFRNCIVRSQAFGLREADRDHLYSSVSN